MEQEFSCYLSFQPPVLFKTAYKAVANLYVETSLNSD